MFSKIRNKVWFFRVLFHIHLIYVLVKLFPPTPSQAAWMDIQIQDLIRRLEIEE